MRRVAAETYRNEYKIDAADPDPMTDAVSVCVQRLENRLEATCALAAQVMALRFPDCNANIRKSKGHGC